MSITASVVISRAQTTLLDATGVLWSSAELIDYLNAAITALIAAKPDVSVSTGSFTLTNAQAKQTIPSDGIQFLDVTRNLSPGLTAIREIQRNHLNHADQNWPNFAGTPQHYIHDKRNIKVFYIYPQPASGTNTVELVYVQTPTRIAATGDTIPVDSLYETPLHNYVVAYAFAKNAKRGDLAKSQVFLNFFNSFLGTKLQAQMAFAPDTPNESGTSQDPTSRQGPTE